MIVQQVVNFTAIDLVHGNSDRKVSLVVLPIVDTTFEQILYGKVLQALHRESLS